MRIYANSFKLASGFSCSSLIAFCLVLPGFAIALTCPKKLSKTPKHTWYSVKFYPTFKKKNVDPKVVVKGNQFGAAVYSLKTKKLACSYGTNSKQKPWVALSTRPSNRIKPDIHALDPVTHKPVWRYTDQHHDYSCTASRDRCVFNYQKVSQH